MIYMLALTDDRTQRREDAKIFSIFAFKSNKDFASLRLCVQ